MTPVTKELVHPEIKDQVGRLYTEATRSLVQAKKKNEEAEKHFHERHVKDGRSALLSAASHTRQAQASLEEIRKTLGLEDPSVIRRKDLVDRLKKTQEDMRKAGERKKQLVDIGEQDSNILNAIDQVVARYQAQREAILVEMSDEGMSQIEIQSAIAL